MIQRNYCVRINVGSHRYKDKKGNLWDADKAYAKSSWGCFNFPQTDVLSTYDSIINTLDTELFQTIRMGEELIYRFDLPNGDYIMRLLFAEIYWETSSAEQQDVYIQDKRVLENFNIYDEAGHDKALEKIFETKVNQGSLEIKFVGRSLPMHSGARVCAIEVKQIREGVKL